MSVPSCRLIVVLGWLLRALGYVGRLTAALHRGAAAVVSAVHVPSWGHSAGPAWKASSCYRSSSLCARQGRQDAPSRLLACVGDAVRCRLPPEMSQRLVRPALMPEVLYGSAVSAVHLWVDAQGSCQPTSLCPTCVTDLSLPLMMLTNRPNGGGLCVSEQQGACPVLAVPVPC